MERNQRTIRTSQSCEGIGLHTGVETIITFHPAPEDFGIRFIRSDIPNCMEVKADIDHVVDISRGTTIEENDIRIHTVEHALAAVSGLRLDNILIESPGYGYNNTYTKTLTTSGPVERVMWSVNWQTQTVNQW